MTDKTLFRGREHEAAPVTTLHRVTLDICEACIDGVGDECHTAGCALFLHSVDIPITVAQVMIRGV